MKTAAGIVFFDDAKGLRRCLNSISSTFDIVIAIDGKFKEFEENYDISMDGSKEVVESYPNTHYVSYPNISEIEKRNKYLEIAGELGIDFLLVIDSDEYAVIDNEIFLSNLEIIKNMNELISNELLLNEVKPEVYGVKMFENHFEKPDRIIERFNERLLYKPGYLRYSIIHSNLIDINNSNRNFTTAKYTSEVEGIILYNDDKLRSRDYINKILRYQKCLFDKEKTYRKEIVGYETLKYK